MINNWRKSSRSEDAGACVEVGSHREQDQTEVGVRDTKSRATGQLGFTGPAWASFVTLVARD